MLPRQPARSDTMVVTFGESIAPDHLDAMCAGLRGALSACDPKRVVCDLARVREPDAATVDLLARLALIARRQNREMALAGVPIELSELLTFVGLGEVPGLCLEPERQAECGENSVDVEEEGDPADPIA